MTDKEYIQYQQKIIQLANEIRQLNGLPDFLGRISKAEALGPILNPTLYRAGMEPMGKIKDMAEALNDCRNELGKD